MTTIIIALIILAVLALVVIMGACVAAGNADEAMERIARSMEDDNTN